MTYFQDVASHVTATIPLNTQSDCAGASRVPFGAQSVSVTAGACNAEPDDSDCVICLREQCCAEVNEACGGDGGTSSATCAENPAVKACVLTATNDSCAAACGGDL